MWIEIGAFGDFHSDGLPREVYAAQIVIPRREFARLGLGDFERPDAAPACFLWCKAAFGMGGPRWCVRLPEDDDATVCFAEPADALAFHARWSAAGSAAGDLKGSPTASIRRAYPAAA